MSLRVTSSLTLSDISRSGSNVLVARMVRVREGGGKEKGREGGRREGRREGGREEGREEEREGLRGESGGGY